MENSEKLNIIAHHWRQLNQDCPCVLRASGKLEVWDDERMPSAEELPAWKAEFDSFIDLSPQKSECIRLLNESEIHVSTDPPYPDDAQTWKNTRKIWRQILKSNGIEEIPPKPFS